MALSQDDQRILAEIERRLATDDPGLASSLTAFRRPGPAKLLRSPRARIVGSLFTVLLVALVSLTVYAMIPFRAHLSRPATPAAVPASTAFSAASTSKPSAAESASAKQQSSASTGATATASSSRSAAYVTSKSQDKTQPTEDALLPATKTP